MKTFLMRALKTLGVLAVLFLLFHLVENWRGKRAWEKWKASREALGDHYDLASYAPAPIPDELNFMAHPMMMGHVKGTTSKWDGCPDGPLLNAVDGLRFQGQRWRTLQPWDLTALAASIGDQDLQQALASYQDGLDHFSEAAQRPFSRMLERYDDPQMIPTLLGFRQLGRLLALRANLRMRSGQPEEALQDISTLLRVVQHLKKEPSLIAQLLRNALVNITLQPIWEGLKDHHWNAVQVKLLQDRLNEVDLLESLRLGWQGERILVVDGAEKHPGGFPMKGARLIPKGWWFQNMLKSDQYLVMATLDPLDSAHHRVYPERQQWAIQTIKQQRRTPYSFLAQMAFPAVFDQNMRVPRIQSGIDQALIACALERFRLAHGSYPESLQDLVPAFANHLPIDLVNGEALRYQRLGKDRFKLYSVGWNLKDEGGQIVLNAKEPAQAVDLEQGDWVWASGQ